MENQGWPGFEPDAYNNYSEGAYPPASGYAQQGYTQAMPSAASPQQNKSTNPVVLGVILGLLIALIALGGFLIYRLADDGAQTASTSTEEVEEKSDSKSSDESGSSDSFSDDSSDSDHESSSKENDESSSEDSEVWAENEQKATPWPPSGATEVCTSDIAVNEVTTCGFASNVESGYRQLGSNGGTVYGVYSPTTNLEYTMVCTNESSTLAVCTGGNNAVVYIRR